MFDRIIVPVDLSHIDKLDKAITVAAGIAKTHDATLHIVSVTPNVPGSVGHTPQEHAQKLEAWAKEQADRLGVPMETHSVPSVDPQIDLDDKILEEAKKLNADLIVMATRVPNFATRLFTPHGIELAAHADMSVFLVR